MQCTVGLKIVEDQQSCLFMVEFQFSPFFIDICDLPRENRPSSHLIMIVEIPVLNF